MALTAAPALPSPAPGETPLEENPPIRQNLRPLLSPDHPEFARPGLPSEVLDALGIGYLHRPVREGRFDPLNERLVFQVRGVRREDGVFQPVILTHMGRATTAEQEAEHGKWWMYPGFRKSRELYNIDRAVLDDAARRQAADTGHVLVVEGAFDVAKLFAAGISNVVATFGAHVSPEQLPRFDLLADQLGITRFLIFYDRDQAGHDPEKQGFVQAAEMLLDRGYEVQTFDWTRSFPSPRRGEVKIPAAIGDPGDFAVEQLAWLRARGEI
ncbi:MAG TPA: toprim domain-containing protein [Thermoanaerobaculia bacterium]|nr:toprim domain-containing protein [Thermoanaerobaculia bacterium]